MSSAQAEMGRGHLTKGITTCAGCAMELIARIVFEVTGSNTSVVIPPGCAALLAGTSDETPLELPCVMSNLEATAAFASGLRAGYDAQGRDDVNVVAFAGDGGTTDIGLQSLSGAMERGERFLYICYDNEAYMNTGIQCSGSTPLSAWTTTTPAGKPVPRKDLGAIVRAHRPAYMATASVAYPKDLETKVRKALASGGFAFIHVHSPCPTGWRFPPAKAIEVGRAAVETGSWVLYEVESGELRVTHRLRKVRPLADYLKLQGRFGNEPDAAVKAMEDDNLARLKEIGALADGN